MEEKMENVKVEKITNYLTESLNCSQGIIASYIGVNESTLSANNPKDFRDIATKKTGKRLSSLYLTIHQLVSKGVAPTVIKEAINEFVYADLDDNFDSVVSAIVADKYPSSVIVNIGELGYQKFKEKLAKRDELFQVVKEVIAASAV